jgi:hypothetical protein
MLTELRDILDYNVTLGGLKSILNIVLAEKNVNMDFLKKYVALNKFDLVSHSISILWKLRMLEVSKDTIVSNVQRDEIETFRALILNRLTTSNDPYIRYLISFLDGFLSTKNYYEQKEVWRMLALIRSKENVKSPHEELSFKFRMLIRHLKELGLAITFGNFIVPIIDPSLLMEVLKHMQFSKGSMYELLGNIRNRYFPCCDTHGKPYGPVITTFDFLESSGLLKLSSRSDAGLEYTIGERKYNFLEVLSFEV